MKQALEPFPAHHTNFVFSFLIASAAGRNVSGDGTTHLDQFDHRQVESAAVVERGVYMRFVDSPDPLIEFHYPCHGRDHS